MRFRGDATLLLIALVAIMIAGCQSTPEPDPMLAEGPVAPLEFAPATAASRIHLDSGRYPNLFSPGSYAIWVEDNVAEAKMALDETAGTVISRSLAADAAYIGENYYVFECNVESMFPDASIAYDVVGLRNVDTYLATPDGRRINALQRILGQHADEAEQGALKRFGRTNILVFPKRDVLTDALTIPPDAMGVRLVVDGFNSSFYFEWPSAAESVIVEEEPVPAGRLSFSSLFGRLRELAHYLQ